MVSFPQPHNLDDSIPQIPTLLSLRLRRDSPWKRQRVALKLSASLAMCSMKRSTCCVYPVLKSFSI